MYLNIRTKFSKLINKDGADINYADYILLAPDLLHLIGKLIMDENVPKKERTKLVATVIYIALPTDVMPEAIFGRVGYLDDILLAVHVLHSVIHNTDPAVLKKHWAGDEELLEMVQWVFELADEKIVNRSLEQQLVRTQGTLNKLMQDNPVDQLLGGKLIIAEEILNTLLTQALQTGEGLKSLRLSIQQGRMDGRMSLLYKRDLTKIHFIIKNISFRFTTTEQKIIIAPDSFPRLQSDKLLKNMLFKMGIFIVRVTGSGERVYNLLLKDVAGLSASKGEIIIDLKTLPAVQQVMGKTILGFNLGDLIYLHRIEMQPGQLSLHWRSGLIKKFLFQ